MELEEKIYWELNRMFSSEHNDNQKEQEQAMNIIKLSLQSGTTEETFYKKMNQMLSKANRTDLYKSKLSNAIRNKFWEKQFVEPIKYRPFKLDA